MDNPNPTGFLDSSSHKVFHFSLLIFYGSEYFGHCPKGIPRGKVQDSVFCPINKRYTNLKYKIFEEIETKAHLLKKKPYR